MRQIVLDTETTGLEPEAGHRIIEIGCVEIINRRITGNHYHQYLQPDREIDSGAVDVHGITTEFLRDKPRFMEVADDFLAYVRGAELIIHNAAFDVGFLNYELRLLKREEKIEQLCGVIDTLQMARRLHPGQKNNLDALCRRYRIDNSQRNLHGALLDAEILADVYLCMTGGQASLELTAGETEYSDGGLANAAVSCGVKPLGLPLSEISETEQVAHEAMLARIREANSGVCVWDHVEAQSP